MKTPPDIRFDISRVLQLILECNKSAGRAKQEYNFDMIYFNKMTGNLVFLSPVQAEDGDLWARWLNDLEVALPLGDEAYTVLPLERMRADAAECVRSQDPVFTIVEKAGRKPVGRALLFGVNTIDRHAMCGLFIGEKECWGKGYGTEALALLLDYGFNLLNLNSIELGVFAFNSRAIASYRRLGFKEIGRKRQARIIAGVAYDVILMDLLAEEFESPFIRPMVGRMTSAG
jgi:RimJ/RimL family protein N-acetyltransferase